MKKKELSVFLEKKTVPELKVLAKKIKMSGYSQSNKQELIDNLLQNEPKDLMKELYPSLLYKYHHHIYGFVGVFALCVSFFFYYFPYQPSNVQSVSNESVKDEHPFISDVSMVNEGKPVSLEEATREIDELEHVFINKGDLLAVKNKSGNAVVSIEVIPVSQLEYYCEANYRWRYYSNDGVETSGSGVLYERNMNLPKLNHIESFNAKLELLVEGQKIKFSCKDEQGVFAYKPQNSVIGYWRNKGIDDFKFN
jgi:hypothetical protein